MKIFKSFHYISYTAIILLVLKIILVYKLKKNVYKIFAIYLLLTEKLIHLCLKFIISIIFANGFFVETFYWWFTKPCKIHLYRTIKNKACLHSVLENFDKIRLWYQYLCFKLFLKKITVIILAFLKNVYRQKFK